MSKEDYSAPVDKLLTIERSGVSASWPAFAELGIGPEHVPDLIRMATDADLQRETESPECWAYVHAWCALGQLRSEAAVEPLLESLDASIEEGIDFALDVMSEVMALIGPAAIAPLRDYLANDSHHRYARMAAADSLWEIAKSHPETREQCVAILLDHLRQYRQRPAGLNACTIIALAELGVLEAGPLAKEAFEADMVETFITGSANAVLRKFGIELAPEEQEAPAATRVYDSSPPSRFATEPDFGYDNRLQKRRAKAKAVRQQKKAERKRRRKRN